MIFLVIDDCHIHSLENKFRFYLLQSTYFNFGIMNDKIVNTFCGSIHVHDISGNCLNMNNYNTIQKLQYQLKNCKRPNQTCLFNRKNLFGLILTKLMLISGPFIKNVLTERFKNTN